MTDAVSHWKYASSTFNRQRTRRMTAASALAALHQPLDGPYRAYERNVHETLKSQELNQPARVHEEGTGGRGHRNRGHGAADQQFPGFRRPRTGRTQRPAHSRRRGAAQVRGRGGNPHERRSGSRHGPRLTSSQWRLPIDQLWLEEWVRRESRPCRIRSARPGGYTQRHRVPDHHGGFYRNHDEPDLERRRIE